MTSERTEYHNNQEFTPVTTKFKVIARDGVSAGVFDDYPDELLQALGDAAPTFASRQSAAGPNHRSSFSLEIAGREVRIKSKFMPGLTAADHQRSYLKLKKQAEEPAQSPDVAKGLLIAANVGRLNSSVANEVLIGRMAVNRFREAYHQDLPLEKAVGFAVDRAGQKWAIFEPINNAKSLSKFSDEEKQKIKPLVAAFTKEISAKLRLIGIEPYDFDVIEEKSDYANVMISKDKASASGYRFTIIDTEMWMPTTEDGNRRQKPRYTAKQKWDRNRLAGKVKSLRKERDSLAEAGHAAGDKEAAATGNIPKPNDDFRKSRELDEKARAFLAKGKRVLGMEGDEDINFDKQ